MSELTITALRFGFLILLWVLIFGIVSAMRRDLMIGRKAAAGAPTARQVRRNPSLAEAPPAPVKQQAHQLVVDRGPAQGHHHPPRGKPDPARPGPGGHPGPGGRLCLGPPCPPVSAGQPLVHRGPRIHQWHLPGRSAADPGPPGGARRPRENRQDGHRIEAVAVACPGSSRRQGRRQHNCPEAAAHHALCRAFTTSAACAPRMTTPPMWAGTSPSSPTAWAGMPAAMSPPPRPSWT